MHRPHPPNTRNSRQVATQHPARQNNPKPLGTFRTPWRARQDSNLRPLASEANALST